MAFILHTVEIELDGQDVTAIGTSSDFGISNAVQEHPIYGEAWVRRSVGKSSATFSVNGDLDAAYLPLLVQAAAVKKLVTAKIWYGEQGNALNDAGYFTGTYAVEGFNIPSEGDGKVTWSMTLASDGAVVYEPGAGASIGLP